VAFTARTIAPAAASAVLAAAAAIFTAAPIGAAPVAALAIAAALRLACAALLERGLRLRGARLGRRGLRGFLQPSEERIEQAALFLLGRLAARGRRGAARGARHGRLRLGSGHGSGLVRADALHQRLGARGGFLGALR